MKFLFEHFDRQSRQSLLIKAYITVAVITVMDYLAGEQLSLFILYFFPTLLVAWYVGRRRGIEIASLSAVGIFVQDLLYAPSFGFHSAADFIPYWNFLQRLLLFVVFSLTVSTLRGLEKEKTQREFKLAREVQSFLLPRTCPPMQTLTYTGALHPASNLSGDFYDFILIEPHKLCLLIGDVCGKGVPAALVMAHLHGVLSSHIRSQSDDLGKLTQTLNASLFTSSDPERFASMFIGVYDDSNCPAPFKRVQCVS
jgi:hypothetical protein